MSFSSHLTPNQWYFQLQDEVNLNPILDADGDSTELTGEQTLYEPFTFLPPTTRRTVSGQSDKSYLYDTCVKYDLEYSPACEGHQDGLFCKDPATVTDLPDILSGSRAANADEKTNNLISNQSILDPSPRNLPRASKAPLATATITSQNPRARRSRRHYCTKCGTSFDRASRARDCANKDLGLTPYACNNRCAKRNCIKAYSSEKLLKEHLAERFTRCPQCSKSLSKKNLARHKQEACH